MSVVPRPKPCNRLVWLFNVTLPGSSTESGVYQCSKCKAVSIGVARYPESWKA
jgi:hypothetical protein